MPRSVASGGRTGPSEPWLCRANVPRTGCPHACCRLVLDDSEVRPYFRLDIDERIDRELVGVSVVRSESPSGGQIN